MAIGFVSFKNPLKKKLSMQSIIADLLFCFQKSDKWHNGLFATYVEYTLHAERRDHTEFFLQTENEFIVAIESEILLNLQNWKLKQARI